MTKKQVQDCRKSGRKMAQYKKVVQSRNKTFKSKAKMKLWRTAKTYRNTRNNEGNQEQKIHGRIKKKN